MLTAPQVLQLLRRADLLSGWPVLPTDEQRAREMAQAWARELDPRLSYDDAMAPVEQHCREQHRPLALIDLNEPTRQKHAPAARGTGALQQLQESERGAVPCPPDLDLHRLRHVKPKYQAVWEQRARTERDRLQARRMPSSTDEFHAVTPAEPGHEDFGGQLDELANPAPGSQQERSAG